jgi:uncharacterized protein (UPF0333 family)
MIKKTIILGLFKKKFKQVAPTLGEVVSTKITINYLTGKFKLFILDEKGNSTGQEKLISDAEDMANAFKKQIDKKSKGQLKNIQIIILDINFTTKAVITEIYYQPEPNKKLKTILSDIF